MPTIGILDHSSMISLINNVDAPAGYLVQNVFGEGRRRPQLHTAKHIEWGELTGDRVAAPFVRIGAEAVPVDGFGERMHTVPPSNIRIKNHLAADEVVFRRRAGTEVFASAAQIGRNGRIKIAERAQALRYQVENAKEWLAAQSLRETGISYAVDNMDVYTVVWDRDPATLVDLGSGDQRWGEANSNPREDVWLAKKTMAKFHQVSCDTAICSALAAQKFREDTKIQTELDTLNYNVGFIDLQRQWSELGAIFLGRYQGINFFEYDREITYTTNDAGAAGTGPHFQTTGNMMRVGEIVFTSSSPRAMYEMHYGGIADMQAFRGRGSVAIQIFSKQWEIEDPSGMVQLAHSRPLPIPRRPNAIYTLFVHNGGV